MDNLLALLFFIGAGIMYALEVGYVPEFMKEFFEEPHADQTQTEFERNLATYQRTRKSASEITKDAFEPYHRQHE